MGREAICECTMGDTTAKVKALLETQELILRGDIHLRAPLHALHHSGSSPSPSASTSTLVPCGSISGPLQRRAGRKKSSHSPPSLADKLGITNKIVRTIGPVSDRALDSALTSAAQIRAENPDLIIACVDTIESLSTALRDAKKQLARGVPIWFVYRKGPGHPINESAIRTTLRDLGFMDTKVASVSTELTALRFNLPRST